MESSFDKITKSKLYEVGSILWDMVALSLLWLIFSIPVITSAAASSALYFSIYRKVKKESDNAVPDFMRSFKSNIRQSIPMSILYTAFAVVIFINIHIARFGIDGITLPEWYLPFAILLLIPFIALYPFAYPCLARFSTDTKHLIMNAAAFSTMNPGKALLMFLITAISVFIMVLFPPCVLLVPYIGAYLKVTIAEKIFEIAIERENNKEDAPDFDDTKEGGSDD